MKKENYYTIVSVKYDGELETEDMESEDSLPLTVVDSEGNVINKL